MKNKSNIILFDNSPEEVEDFTKSLSRSTSIEWKSIFCKSNGIRNSFFKQIERYLKYFVFPFKIFLKRKEYDNILAWQLFYGLIFAFYSKLFFVKKRNNLFVNIFIYKPKKGIIKSIYHWFIKFILKSELVDIYSFTSKKHLAYCSEIFPFAQNKFAYIPYGVQDFSKSLKQNDSICKDFVLSIGRSNRDFGFLMDSLKNTDYKCKILSDELRAESPSSNIEIYNSISGAASHPYFANCKCVVIPIKDVNIDGGQTVLITAFAFGKPVIVTARSTLAEEYVNETGGGGIVMDNTKESLLNALGKIYGDDDFYKTLCENARKKYEKEYSVAAYGERWAEAIMRRF